MTNQVRVLRVVVASPADVLPEREKVDVVVEELNKSVAADRGLRMDVIRWETDAYPGFHPEGPQGLIDPIIRIEDCDVLVGIFWKHFGTPTKQARSGAEQEFRQAYKTWKKKRRPQIMVYFNQKAHTPQSKKETDQWGKVLAFRKAFPKEALWWPYKGTPEFEKLLRTHLTNFLRATFPIGGSEPEPERPAPAAAPRADYFAVQTKIVAEYTRTFAGRIYARNAFEKFLADHKRGYFIVRGGPGQGKTAFSCHLVKTGGYVHHFINRTGGRTDPRLILRSLLSQLALSNGGEKLPESLCELTKIFEERLPLVAARRKRLVVVIDALDELPAETVEEPPYLVADALPDGVYFVVTSRPGDRLDRLQERRFAVPHDVYELGPLDISEMRDVLRACKPDITQAEVERIAEASQGNPLYLRAVADQLAANPAYDLRRLPRTIEGFFRDATSGLSAGNAVLGDVLGLLSAARTPLSLRHLSEIMSGPQREIHERGIRPIRPFLLEIDSCYTFYHTRFHEFVTKTIVYEDELRRAHRKVADWLERPKNRGYEYRWASLAHHLFESGSRDELIQSIDEEFLAEKVRRLGYAVLEDVELRSRCLLETGDPALVERCVSMVEGLRKVVGGDIIADAAKVVQSYRAGPESFRTRLIAPVVPSIPGVDIYVGVLPKAEVPADFFEVVPAGNRLFVAIGDAPSIGLKSAFVARFIGNLFRDLVEKTGAVDLADALAKLNATLRSHDYFERVSMQCIAIEPKRGVLYLANAGHPYPVHYSARRGKCDILPVRGDILHHAVSSFSGSETYQQYGVEIGPGDIFVLVTDGLTEGHLLGGDPYGYRFMEIIETRAKEGAQRIGEAILDNWRAHPREEDSADDVSVIVMAIGEAGSR